MHDLLSSGKTILMASHSEKEIKKVCTRAILLQKGELIMDGNPEELVKFYRASINGNAPANRKANKGNRKIKIETPEGD